MFIFASDSDRKIRLAKPQDTAGISSAEHMTDSFKTTDYKGKHLCQLIQTLLAFSPKTAFFLPGCRFSQCHRSSPEWQKRLWPPATRWLQQHISWCPCSRRTALSSHPPSRWHHWYWQTSSACQLPSRWSCMTLLQPGRDWTPSPHWPEWWSRQSSWRTAHPTLESRPSTGLGTLARKWPWTDPAFPRCERRSGRRWGTWFSLQSRAGWPALPQGTAKGWTWVCTWPGLIPRCRAEPLPPL